MKHLFVAFSGGCVSVVVNELTKNHMAGLFSAFAVIDILLALDYIINKK